MLNALLLLAAAASGNADPLAEARAGKIQCISPNRAAKTCMGLGSFSVNKDGTYNSRFTMLIAPSPQITVEVRAPGTVEDGQVCNVARRSDYENATVLMDGAPANPLVAQAILGQLTNAVSSLEGKKACARNREDGDTMIAEAFVDGTARPDLNQRYIWVKASEGFRLGQ